jgi:hypothetical protein
MNHFTSPERQRQGLCARRRHVLIGGAVTVNHAGHAKAVEETIAEINHEHNNVPSG